MPEDNEVYLAVPYLNEDGLELYTKLILRKLAGLVISSNTNIHDYEQEYSANPQVEVVTLPNVISPDTVWNLPVSYGVGTGQLRVTVSGYIMYPGIDYEEVGNAGEISNQIKFLTSIDAGSILGVVVYPKQFSFGRNINVSNLMAPELALSTSQTSLLSVDEDQRIVLEKSTIQDLIDASIEGVLHSEGTEEVVGQKTFFKPLNVDATALNLTRNQIQAIVNASFKANGMQYDIQPISVIAGAETDSPYNGALMVGSNTGCTWIGAGESFFALPSTFNGMGIDFAEEESIILTSDTKIAFYVGCGNDGANIHKAAEFSSDGSTTIYGPAYAPTPPLDDSSTRIATTEFVKQTSFQLSGDQIIDGVKTFVVSPLAPTPEFNANDLSVATVEFVKTNAVLLTTDQRIDGLKTFSSNIKVSSSDPTLEIVEEQSIKGTRPSRRSESGVAFYDRVGNALGMVRHRYDPNGESSITIQAIDASSSESTATASIGIAFDADGKSRTFAPTPAVGDASSKIATTKHVDDTLTAFKAALIEMLQRVIVVGEFDDEAEAPVDFDFTWK